MTERIIMKHKKLNRDGWGFQHYPYYQMRIDHDIFHGLVCMIRLTDGEENYWTTPKAGRIQVTGTGMTWLQLIPDDTKRVITVMYFPDGTHDKERLSYPEAFCTEYRPSIWYVDVIDGIEYDENGIAVFIDKYLDVIFTPEGDVKIDDRDELDAAYHNGELSEEQYREALEECDKIISDLCADIQATDIWCSKIREIVESKMKKYQIDTDENKEYLKGLREDLLRFGQKFPSPGGSSYYLGDDGTPWTDRPRETWITSRMAHVYSMAAIMGWEGGARLAEEAIKGLITELHDDDNGGWYAGICQDGSILPGKHCYAHAFVILAASSGILAGIPDAEKLFRDATEIYDRFFWNEEEGLSADTWDTGFKELSSYRGLNANMHTVEAFLAASDVSSDERYRIRAGRIIDRVIGWAEDNKWRIPEHFDDSWKVCLYLNEDKPDDPFKPFGATPGHGIEWARLIVQWALSTYGKDNAEADKYITAAIYLYDRAVKDAWFADGTPGLCYTTDWNGAPVVHDRMHWTLAEAINTSAVLYRVTADPKYAGDYEMFMEYLDRYVVDHKNTSWFHQLDSDNRPIGTVWPGKPDLYHAVQATLIPYVKDTAVSVAAALR